MLTLSMENVEDEYIMHWFLLIFNGAIGIAAAQWSKISDLTSILILESNMADEQK